MIALKSAGREPKMTPTLNQKQPGSQVSYSPETPAATTTDVVTGAFSYTGKYLTRQLLAEGRSVRTLTGHPDRQNEFGDTVAAHPYSFDDPAMLTESLRGADTLYNTYWVRFARGNVRYDAAVENTGTLIRAAEQAGVRRIVHVSITNPSLESPFAYFRGKAQIEKMITESSLSYSILRPTVIFGDEDILINNVAWLLRRLRVFGVPGDGKARLQPIFVEDLAELMAAAGQSATNEVIDAVGPETFTFEEMVRLIHDTIGVRALIVNLPAGLIMPVVSVLNRITGDVVLTRDELDGLLADLIVTDSPPTGHTRLSDWLADHADTVGTKYHSELARHF